MSLGEAYRGKRVLVTGHTGFKGAWLTLWLAELGAEVTGYALAPLQPSLFEQAGVENYCRHLEGDVRDRLALKRAFEAASPEIVFHLAAQALVRRSYAEPLETIEINVVGTANVLEMARQVPGARAIVVVTSDKCYESNAVPGGHSESDPMGGHDIYSMSKGAAELVTASYRRSFFPPARLAEHGVAVATARAGNVIGGGDWAVDRIIPDAVRALQAGKPILVRNPDSVRPWQHVLEPLGGYQLLGAKLLGAEAAAHCEPWNFGPADENAKPVRDLVDGFVAAWGGGSWQQVTEPGAPHETAILKLNIEKAAARVGWRPRWGFQQTLQQTTTWYRARDRGAAGPALLALCRRQIAEYAASPR